MKQSIKEQPQLHTTLPYSPKEIVDLTDGDSNAVYGLDQKYIYKEFFSTSQMHHETAGSIIFNLLSSFGVPLVLDKGNTYVLFEYIPSHSCFNLYHTAGMISQEQIAQKTAAFIAEIYWNYRYFKKDKIKLFPYMSWEERFSDIHVRARSIQGQMRELMSREDFLLYRDAVSSLDSIKQQNYQLSFLHRDIHLDNILIREGAVGRDSTYVIDFEHCMEGPVELELQNAIFWKDKWSVPVGLIRDLLVRKHDVPYSNRTEQDMLSVYYLDQLVIATNKKDIPKVRLLTEVYSERCAERYTLDVQKYG